MLLLSAADLYRIIDQNLLIEAISDALSEISAGEGDVPVRLDVSVPPSDGHLLIMPAYLPRSKALAMKLVSVFPDNPRRGLPLVAGVVALHDPRTGTPIALMNGAAITALRTASASALATRTLARQNASVLGLLGAGVQARAHLRALAKVRSLREVRVIARTPESGRRFVDDMHSALDAPIRVCETLEDAVRGADLIVAATSATEPVIRAEWLSPGMHICAIGFGTGLRELETEVVTRADVIAVDTRAGALEEAEDLRRPIEEGRLSPSRVVELGEILIGKAAGRKSPEQITLYKSVGTAAMDAAAAALAYRLAEQLHVGSSVEL